MFDVEYNPSFLREKFHNFGIPPDLDHCACCGIFWQDGFPASPTHLNAVLLFFVLETLFIQFYDLFQRKLSQV